MNKTFKIIVKSGTLSLPSGAVVFFWEDRLRQPRDGTMLDETPHLDYDIICPDASSIFFMSGRVLSGDYDIIKTMIS